MKKKGKTGCFIVAGVVAVLGVCLIVSTLGLGVSEYIRQPRMVTGFNFRSSSQDTYTYSPGQQALVETWGEPQSFTILFYQREDPQGYIETVRHEEWAYPLQSTAALFENGMEIERRTIPGAAELYPTRYSPGQFLAFMEREQLAAMNGLTEWLILPMQEELVKDAELYYTGGLTFGLQDGELIYVEAVYYEDADSAAVEQPIYESSPDQSSGSEAPGEMDSLTMEEAACQGLHSYTGVYYMSGEMIGEEAAGIDVMFQDGGLMLTLDDEPMHFSRTAENQYLLDEEDEIWMELIFTPAGLTLRFDEDGEYVELVYSLVGGSTDELTPQERANQGTHQYDVTLMQGSEVITGTISSIEFTFQTDGCLMVENGETSLFSRTAANQYQHDEDSTILLTFHIDGFSIDFYSEGVDGTYILRD